MLNSEVMEFSVRELRVRSKLTQAEVAKELGIFPSQYSRWENNIGTVSFARVKRLAEVFQVSVNVISTD